MTSLLHQTDLSMRPNTDKEIETIDLDQLFDQYVETDLLHHFSDVTADPSSSDDLAHLFELPSSNGSIPYETPALPDWDASTDAWQKALQKLAQDPASPSMPDNSFPVYPLSHGKASLSDPDLFTFEDLFELDKVEPRAVSQPSTPKPHIARPARKARSSPDRSFRPTGIHKTPRKSPVSTIASKMLRPSQYRAGYQDIWTRKMDHAAETFNLQMPPNSFQSPPPSTKLVSDENPNNFFSREHQPYTIAMSPLAGADTTTSEMQHSNYQLTPLSSPAMDANSSRDNAFQFSSNNDNMAYISHMSNAALSALQTPPPSHRLAMSKWGSDASPNLDFSSFSASPEFQSGAKAGGWWGGNGNGAGGAGSMPVTQPSTPVPYHTSNSRSASQNYSFSAASVAGLGISCDTASFSGMDTEMGGHASATLPPSASSFDMAYYTQPATPGIPIGHAPAYPSSRSPSLSPQPRFTRRRHSSHPNAQNSSRSRRKSSNSSNQSAHTRSGSGSGSFVNFTPDDSRKILTGVAPSGSSKTKARREKEAAEKRRKLSQAAMKAVMEAGGDVRRLEKEGLLVLES